MIKFLTDNIFQIVILIDIQSKLLKEYLEYFELYEIYLKQNEIL